MKLHYERDIVHVIGVPLDLGGNRRGVDMGPSAVRMTGLSDSLKKIGFTIVDKADIDVPLPEECDIGNPNQKYAEDIDDVCEDLCTSVKKSMEAGAIPVSIGGDHSIAMGSVAGVSSYFRDKRKKIGLLWLDAHGDMNTPDSTNSGNVHGMPFSHVLGIGSPHLAAIGGFKPKVESGNAVLMGVRNIDERERQLITDSKIHVFTMKDIDRLGIPKVLDKALDFLNDGTEGFHLSFDMDVVDPLHAPGVGTPVKGGLNYRESHLLMELIADTGKMTSLDVVEINPILDNHNDTAQLACELILSAFGKEIF